MLSAVMIKGNVAGLLSMRVMLLAIIVLTVGSNVVGNLADTSVKT
jgi:hypothetical protein